jgi:hypothetical protein
VDDIDEVLKAAGDLRFQETCGHFLLNPLSVLSEPRRHIKVALKERIRGLMAAYISLATFVEDEEVFAILDEPKRSARLYRRVMKNMDQYKKEIKAFLRELAE